MTTPTTTESNVSPVKHLDPHQKAIERARALHDECCTHATKAVRAAIQCGALLRDVRSALEHGQWAPFLEACGLSRPTAFRYISVCESFDASSKHLLEGKSLSDLYRELGLIKPAAGGGNRLGGEELARRREADQLTFHYTLIEDAFAEVTRYAKATGHTNPFQSLDSDTLAATREQLTKALALVEAALAAN